MRVHASILVLGMLVASTIAGSSEPVRAHSGDVLSAFGTAAVDGIISPGEYGSCIGPITQGEYTFTICETNDLENDYYAFTVDDLTNEARDYAVFFFDNEHDGMVPAYTHGLGEDAITAEGDGTFFDQHYGYVGGGLNAGTESGADVDGAAAAAFTSGRGYVYEMSHPLNSGDPLDYSLSTGSTVGWCLFYRDFSGERVRYPTRCVERALVGDASEYGDIVKLSIGPPVGGDVLAIDRLRILLPWLLSVGLLGLVTVQALTGKRRSRC